MPVGTLALVASPFVAATLGWQGRRRSRSWTSIGVVSLLVVVTAWILSLTLDAFPGSQAWGGAGLPANLVPLRLLLKHASGGYGRTELRLVSGNVAVFVPFGLMLPLAVRACRRWWATVAVGLAFSMTIELLQLQIPGRQSDVDDVILNTLGVAIGYGVYRLALALSEGIKRRALPA